MTAMTIGTLVRVAPWKDGDRLDPQDGVLVEEWGPEPGWVVWFYGDGTAAPVPGPTAQGFFERELADHVTGTVSDLPLVTLHRLRETMKDAQRKPGVVSYQKLADRLMLPRA